MALTVTLVSAEEVWRGGILVVAKTVEGDRFRRPV